MAPDVSIWLVIALALTVALLLLGEALSPGFASGQQILRLLIVAALLGIQAAAASKRYVRALERLKDALGPQPESTAEAV